MRPTTTWLIMSRSFVYFRGMLAPLFKKDKIIALLLWSFFSFSAVKFFSLFIYSLNHLFLCYAALYSLLFFIYYFVLKFRYDTKLTYAQYTLSNILFVTIVTAFSYCYQKLVMLDNDYFDFRFFLAILISNLLIASLLYPLTLIKRR